MDLAVCPSLSKHGSIVCATPILIMGFVTVDVMGQITVMGVAHTAGPALL